MKKQAKNTFSQTHTHTWFLFVSAVATEAAGFLFKISLFACRCFVDDFPIVFLSVVHTRKKEKKL